MDVVKLNNKIDFVILWVDNNDVNWQKEKEKYEKEYSNIDNRNIRYRDYGLLKYWFRGVEKYAPWVNKIHFITCGHLPDWLDTSNPKLHIVKHSDYMPNDALPTFNSNAIELLMHKIDGLEEKFVAFNDDMFITDKVKEKDFFKNDLPCNTMSLAPVIPFSDTKFYKAVANNVEIINRYFDYNKSIKENIFKYLSLKRGKYILKSYPLLIYNDFPGFTNYHIPISYLKSTFEEVWSKESNLLMKTVYSRFRDNINNNTHWLFNYWQFASGKFNQRNYRFGKEIKIDDNKLFKIIEKHKYKIIGISDTDNVDFDLIKNKLINSFEKILPEKSSYEK